jgi:hypothetical protein
MLMDCKSIVMYICVLFVQSNLFLILEETCIVEETFFFADEYACMRSDYAS